MALPRNLFPKNFGAPGSRLEIPEWFGRPYLHPYSVAAVRFIPDISALARETPRFDERDGEKDFEFRAPSAAMAGSLTGLVHQDTEVLISAWD